tara:strand:- start:476 stop:628 length:153 start_codon:yes stop_codon:yes gene_type:complete
MEQNLFHSKKGKRVRKRKRKRKRKMMKEQIIEERRMAGWLTGTERDLRGT